MTLTLLAVRSLAVLMVLIAFLPVALVMIACSLVLWLLTAVGTPFAWLYDRSKQFLDALVAAIGRRSA